MNDPRPAAPAPAPRRRFYRRRRFWAWSGISLLSLGLVALLLAYWLLQTVAGRDVLLAQIIARLPAGASLTWNRIEGPLAGPLTLYGVDFKYDQIHFTAERAHLEPDLRPLLGRKLRLDVLELSNATLDVPKSDEPFELPRWPDSLPQIEMPLAIQADAIAIDGLRISQAGKPIIDIHRLRGGIDIANGEFQARELVIESDRGHFVANGFYQPRYNYRTDLLIGGTLAAPPGRTPARAGLVARGNLSQMNIALSGHAPEPLRAMLTVTGKDDPRWRFSAKTESLDLALLGITGATTPLNFDLQASGTGGMANVHGRIAQGDTALTIKPSRIRVENQVLTVAPLVVEALEGHASLRGTADFNDPENARFRFSVNARGMKFGNAPDPAQPNAPTTPIGVDADLGVAGNLKNWAAIGDATLTRAGEQAKLTFDGRGNDQQMQLKTLHVRMPTGTLDASGQIGWTPQMNWELKATLAGFDPGYFVPGWDGNVSGRMASKGQQQPVAADGQAGRINATLDVPALNGTLRSRPLNANGNFVLQGAQGSGELALSLGNSRITAHGSVGDRIDIDAAFQPLQLDDLLPDSVGSLRGTMRLRGPRNAPDVDADLTGNGLRWNDWSADTISINGRLPWRGDQGRLTVRGSNLQLGIPIASVGLEAVGAVENLQLRGNLDSATGALALSGAVRRSGTNWLGSIETLQLTPSRGASWRLQQPAPFTLNADASRWTLGNACLSPTTGGAALCANADWPGQGLRVNADTLPLSLIEPWLPLNNGRPMTLRGEARLDATLRPRGSAWEGNIHLASPDGGLRLGDSAHIETIQYDQFSFDAQFDPQQIKARLGSGFKGAGFIDATVATGWDAAAPLNGEIYLNMSRLFWLELFSPDLVRPEGLVEGHVSLRGTRGQPSLGGNAVLSNFRGELPALGLTLTDGGARLDAMPDGSARITGSMKSGEGRLNIDGGLSWFGNATPLQLNIRGENVLVSNTRELRAVANPNLQVGLVGTTIQLRGEVTLPSADIDLERLDEGVSVSEDVVVLDPIDPEYQRTSTLDMDLGIVLGDQVKINGFGLTGSLSGQIRVRGRPGREMTATGGLNVEGRYKAYGQELQITRGQLNWSNNIVSDPRINIRAERQIGDVTAGIDVTGRAQAPRADIWSDPSMQRSEALSYLVLGRSLSVATSSEASQINAASAALSAGSGLLASQLGARLGLDDAGVSQSRALGGSVLGVGKYLTPRVYVSYGVSLIGAGQVLTLKFLLRRGFNLELESSTVENRASINYRRER